MNTKQKLVLWIAIAGLLTGIILSASNGAMQIPPLQVISIFGTKLGLPAFSTFRPEQENVLWAIRLPRVILGVFIGAALALSGASMQGLFRNPLADPGLIGISAGASLCAVLVIVLISKVSVQIEGLIGFYTLNIITFLGACITSVAVYALSRNGGKTIVTTMLLAGVAVNALCGALTGLITFYATDIQLRNITFWSLGSLGGASWNTVLAILPFVVLPVLLLPRLSKSLNALSLGESEAGHIGIHVDKLKFRIIILSTMAVGASVAVAGIIGFVGLVVPHILRMAAGSDNRFILITSSVSGALLLTVADLLARTIISPAELPIGIITAIVGTPLFIWILWKHKRDLYSI